MSYIKIASCYSFYFKNLIELDRAPKMSHFDFILKKNDQYSTQNSFFQ